MGERSFELRHRVLPNEYERYQSLHLRQKRQRRLLMPVLYQLHAHALIDRQFQEERHLLSRNHGTQDVLDPLIKYLRYDVLLRHQRFHT